MQHSIIKIIGINLTRWWAARRVILYGHTRHCHRKSVLSIPHDDLFCHTQGGSWAGCGLRAALQYSAAFVHEGYSCANALIYYIMGTNKKLANQTGSMRVILHPLFTPLSESPHRPTPPHPTRSLPCLCLLFTVCARFCSVPALLFLSSCPNPCSFWISLAPGLVVMEWNSPLL